MQEMTRRDFLKGAAMAGGAVMLGGLHGLSRVQAAGADAKVPEYDPLLDGVCDIHMHLAPDVKERCTDEYTFARNAQAAGYRAVMYKTNEWSYHDRAYLIRQALPGFEVFGSFCMNFTYGDKINVYAAKMAAATTGRLCRCIWMPTQASRLPVCKVRPAGQGHTRNRAQRQTVAGGCAGNGNLRRKRHDFCNRPFRSGRKHFNGAEGA